MGVILMCSLEFDVAHCGITVKNVALNFLLVGHPLCIRYIVQPS